MSQVQLIKMGPLWNNEDAMMKAEVWTSHNPGWTYSGVWNTTIPGEMSVIEVRMNEFHPHHPHHHYHHHQQEVIIEGGYYDPNMDGQQYPPQGEYFPPQNNNW